MADDSLFDDPDLDHGPDLAERRTVRRQVLAGILRVIRGRNDWSVNDAASAASIAPMTWRRLEDGLDVRKRTLTALDSLLGQPFGTVRRALDDDLVMVSLTGLADVDASTVAPEDAGAFLDALAERFRTGTVDSNPRGLRPGPKPRASAD
ncbi:MAG: helix-turn-helix domain-containing protein, partial [Pseudonocardia sp.]